MTGTHESSLHFSRSVQTTRPTSTHSSPEPSRNEMRSQATWPLQTLQSAVSGLVDLSGLFLPRPFNQHRALIVNSFNVFNRRIGTFAMPMSRRTNYISFSIPGPTTGRVFLHNFLVEHIDRKSKIKKNIYMKKNRGKKSTVYAVKERLLCLFRFYGSFKNISLISRRPFYESGENRRKTTWSSVSRTSFSLVTRVKLELTAVRDLIFKCQRSQSLGHGGR